MLRTYFKIIFSILMMHQATECSLWDTVQFHSKNQSPAWLVAGGLISLGIPGVIYYEDPRSGFVQLCTAGIFALPLLTKISWIPFFGTLGNEKTFIYPQRWMCVLLSTVVIANALFKK